MILSILSAIAEILGFGFVGWFASRLNYIKNDDIGAWSKFAVDFLFPALIFNSIVHGFTVETFYKIWYLPFIGFGIMFLGNIIGLFLCKGLRTDDIDTKNVFKFIATVNNYTFLPLVIIRNLYGEDALVNLFFLNIGSIIGFWTLGVGVLGGKGFLSSIKSIITPALLVIPVSIFFAITGLNRYIPTSILKVIAGLGHSATPIIIVLIGASMRISFANVNWFNLLYTVFSRVIIIPVISIIPFFFLPISTDIFNMSVIVASMPSSVTGTIIVRRYGGNHIFAIHVAILTTLFSIITIPILLNLLLR